MNIFYTPDLYNVRAKKYLDYKNKTESAKVFNQIYSSRFDHYKKLINTYLNRGSRPKHEKVPVALGIIVRNESNVLVVKESGQFLIPSINGLDRNEFEDYFCTVIVPRLFRVNQEPKLIGQSGIRPEKELYFFLVKIDDRHQINLNHLKEIIDTSSTLQWVNISSLKEKNVNPNHLPFIQMGWSN